MRRDCPGSADKQRKKMGCAMCIGRGAGPCNRLACMHQPYPWIGAQDKSLSPQRRRCCRSENFPRPDRQKSYCATSSTMSSPGHQNIRRACRRMFLACCYLSLSCLKASTGVEPTARELAREASTRRAGQECLWLGSCAPSIKIETGYSSGFTQKGKAFSGSLCRFFWNRIQPTTQ